MAKTKTPTESEVRHMVLNYFHERYLNGRSERGDSTGVAAKISVIKRDLKNAHGLKQQEVQRALTYLMDQGWVTREEEQKSFSTKMGTTMPAVTPYYRISAAGIDKIEGESEFTMPKFHGINIEATGQNIITIGDGNQVDARFESIANNLAAFKDEVRANTELSDSDKLAVVADVESMQAQLAKPEPNRPVLRAIWAGIEKVVTGTTLAANAATLATALAPVLG